MAKKDDEKKNIELSDQITRELDKAIDDLNLFDDDLMSKVFDGNIEATELLLKIILERDDIYYKPLAEGVRHFKETEEGRDIMCESFEKLANKYADQIGDARAEQSRIETLVESIKSLMDNMKLSLQQALDALNIQGKDRAIIAKQLQK